MGNSLEKNTNQLVLMLLAGIFLSVGLVFAYSTWTDIVTEKKTVTVGTNTSASLNPPSFYTKFDKDGDGTTDNSTRGVTCAAGSSTVPVPTTLSDDGSTLTIGTAGDANSTCTYVAQKQGGVDQLLVAVPFFVIIGMVVGLFGLGALLSGTGPLHERVLAGFILLVIGGILLGIQSVFITSANNLYNGTGYTGVTEVLPLVRLGFGLALVLGALSVGVGGQSLAGRAYNRVRRGRRGRRRRMMGAYR